MPESLHAVDAATGVNLQAAADEVDELRVALEHFVNTLEPDNILNMLDPILINISIPEKPPQRRVPGLLHHPPRKSPTHLLNHGQMLIIGMRRKQQLPRKQLADNTANGPHIADLVPLAALQDDLRGTVLPCVNGRAVVLVVFCCAAEIYYADCIAVWHVVLVTGGGLVWGFVVVLGFEQDVLGF